MLKIVVDKILPLGGGSEVQSKETKILTVETNSIFDAQVDADRKEVQKLTQEVRVAHEHIHQDKASVEQSEANSLSSAKASEVSATQSASSAASSKTYSEQSLASANKAKVSETNAKTSETNALASERAAKTSELNADTSEGKALASERAAKASEVAAASSASTASDKAGIATTKAAESLASANKAKVSETNAKASETKAKVSETNAKASEVEATEQMELATEQAVISTTKANEAAASATRSATSASQSSTYASNSSDSADDSATSASESANHASNSADSASESAAHAAKSKTSETNSKASEVAAANSTADALDSANKAKTSETNSKTSETNSSNSASASATSASKAKVSETNSKTSEAKAKTSETNSKASEVAAKASETKAKTSEVAALDSEEAAAASASTASTKASQAAASASTASTKASQAAASAAEALDSEEAALSSKNAAAASASTATTKASQAAASASNASTSSNHAQSSEEAAESFAIRAENAAATLTGALVEAGNVDLSTGKYPNPIIDVNGTKRACFWKVVKGGTVSGVDYGVGDSLVYSAETNGFYKIDNTESVTSVDGRKGIVTLSDKYADKTDTLNKDAQNVKITGNQIIAGNKTWNGTARFNQSVVIDNILKLDPSSGTYSNVVQFQGQGLLSEIRGSSGTFEFVNRTNPTVVSSVNMLNDGAPTKAEHLTRKDYVDTKLTTAGWGGLSRRFSGDLDTILYNTITGVDVSASTNEPPSVEDGILVCEVWDHTDWGNQKYTDFHSGKTFIRLRNNGAWEPWQESSPIRQHSQGLSTSQHWHKMCTVTMPQSASTVIITVESGSGFNVGQINQLGTQKIHIRSGNNNPKGINIVSFKDGGLTNVVTDMSWKNISGDVYEIYAKAANYPTSGVIYKSECSTHAKLEWSGVSVGTTEPTGTTGWIANITNYNTNNKPTWEDVGGNAMFTREANGYTKVASSWLIANSNDNGFLPYAAGTGSSSKSSLGTSSWWFKSVWSNEFRGGSVSVTSNVISGNEVQGKLGRFTSGLASSQLVLKRDNLGSNVGIRFETSNAANSNHLNMREDGKLAWGTSADSNQNAEIYTTANKPTASDVGSHTKAEADGKYVKYDMSGSSTYPRIFGTSSEWVRVGMSGKGGMLPYANGQTSIGTSSWKFKEIHAVNFWENGTTLTNKYIQKNVAIRIGEGDLNNFDGSGFYNIYIASGKTIANLPTGFGSFGTLLVTGGNASGDFCTQIATEKSAGKTWIRTRNDGSQAWQPWDLIYTSAHKPSAGDVGAYTKAESDGRFLGKTAKAVSAVTADKIGSVLAANVFSTSHKPTTSEVDGIIDLGTF